ncbi:hypothetical protein NC651_017656 [Populus alba x Populus x berolinensis]|nr:hypothetical protein NC651_017656 [Populus alba x Populus x berolinensis]
MNSKVKSKAIRYQGLRKTLTWFPKFLVSPSLVKSYLSFI